VRIGVVSDIHGNLAALEAVLADLGSVDALWCLGDVVGYGPEPNGCIARLRDLGALCIAGNHDWAVLGHASVEDFNADAASAARWTAERLEPEARAWLDACPQVLRQDPVTLAHGSPCDPIWEYVLSGAVARRSLGCFQTMVCLIGHTHVPSSFVEQPDGSVEAEYRSEDDVLSIGEHRLLANPGSVGQPRDQDPRAAYLIYDSDAATLTWRRTPYPIAVTQELMLQEGLPPRLAHRLALGR
jgi:diadenosine tetraphosphatase ApaH/serine/threonine PP2A family protein phosphatase